jgi:alpha-glucuronidase
MSTDLNPFRDLDAVGVRALVDTEAHSQTTSVHHRNSFRCIAQVGQMQMTWDKMRPFVDPERFSQVESFLKIQHREAEWWHNASIAYFQNFSKRPLPEGHEPPPHDLAYYKSLQFPCAPGQGK